MLVVLAENNEKTIHAITNFLQEIQAQDLKIEKSGGFTFIHCQKIEEKALKRLQEFPAIIQISLDSKTKYPLGSRQEQVENTKIKVRNTIIGGNNLTIMAGPCGVEREEQVMSAAKAVKAAGATILRGGAFKPRTSPYAFQGLGEEGLKILKQASDAYDIPIITEILNQRQVELVAQYADILQVGMRNMYNYELLKEVGATRKPVMLKRNHAATIEEWILAAEYLAVAGCRDIIMCERGIRTFSPDTRFTLDISAVPLIKLKTHYPVIVDASHAAGCRELVIPLAKSGIAAGADGIMVEVHPDPIHAQSDGDQSLTPQLFASLVEECKKIPRN